MKKTCIGIRAALVAASLSVSMAAHAGDCSINSISGDTANELLDAKGWTLKNYAAVCSKLKAAGASLYISAAATVLGGRSIGWADVEVGDHDVALIARAGGGSSTTTNDYASMDKAREMMYQSIMAATNSIDWDKALKSLEEERRKVRALK